MANENAAKKITRLEKGKAPTLLEAAKGNEVIDAVNKLLTAGFDPPGGVIRVGDKNIIIDLRAYQINQITSILARLAALEAKVP